MMKRMGMSFKDIFLFSFASVVSYEAFKIVVDLFTQ